MHLSCSKGRLLLVKLRLVLRGPRLRSHSPLRRRELVHVQGGELATSTALTTCLARCLVEGAAELALPGITGRRCWRADHSKRHSGQRGGSTKRESLARRRRLLPRRAVAKTTSKLDPISALMCDALFLPKLLLSKLLTSCLQLDLPLRRLLRLPGRRAQRRMLLRELLLHLRRQHQLLLTSRPRRKTAPGCWRLRAMMIDEVTLGLEALSLLLSRSLHCLKGTAVPKTKTRASSAGPQVAMPAWFPN